MVDHDQSAAAGPAARKLSPASRAELPQAARLSPAGGQRLSPAGSTTTRLWPGLSPGQPAVVPRIIHRLVHRPVRFPLSTGAPGPSRLRSRTSRGGRTRRPATEPPKPEPVQNRWESRGSRTSGEPARLNAKYTFDTFVIGASNRFAARGGGRGGGGAGEGVQPAVHLRRLGPGEDAPAARDRPLRAEPATTAPGSGT